MDRDPNQIQKIKNVCHSSPIPTYIPLLLDWQTNTNFNFFENLLFPSLKLLVSFYGQGALLGPSQMGQKLPRPKARFK
jgi:hypothetical protein